MAVGDEILKLLKFTVQDFIRKDDSGKVIFRKTFRQAVLYAYDNAYAGRSEQRQQYAALKAAIAANSTALKALAERHEDIAGLPELVSELDAAVDKLNELPLATALVREEEEAGEPQ